MNRKAEISRKTKETDIKLLLDLSNADNISIKVGVPFFEHMLTSMAFHGGFSLNIQASGDIEVDPHHLVEDIGIVLGSAFKEIFLESKEIQRFGQFIIPMDDALCETVVDVCARPYLNFRGEFPQAFSGDFDMSLLKEFFIAFSNKAEINLHLIMKYGENSHHMAEALFKSMGKALSLAFKISDKGIKSTKGSL